MKKFTLTLALVIACVCLAHAQQTLWVTTGNVNYGFDTQQVNVMTYSAGGDSLTIQGKTFAISDIDSLHVASGIMEYNTVIVNYAGSNAYVNIAGNIATWVDATVDGAHVSIVQDSLLVNNEIFYTLSGASDDGSFYQHGDMKATFILNGLTLTSTKGAAITIDDGKRIEIQVCDSTVNTLTDCAKGKQSACLVVEGHTEFKGAGTLILTGNTKHGFKGDEYVELKKSFLGSIIVKDAVGDGFNVNQYLEVKAGSLIIEHCGDDGVQVDKKQDNTKEFNGQFIMSGGLVQVLSTGSEGRGLKIEDLVTITDGTIEITSSGNGIHSKADIVIDGGSIYTYSTSANGVNASNNLTVNGGNIVAYGVSTSGYGLRGTSKLYINGGNIAAVGAMTSTPQTTTENQPAMIYKGVLTCDTNLTLDADDGTNVLALTITRDYSSSKQHTLLLSVPAINAGSTYMLNSGATLDTEKDNWHNFYYGGDAVIEAGDTTLGTATAAVPYATLN